MYLSVRRENCHTVDQTYPWTSQWVYCTGRDYAVLRICVSLCKGMTSTPVKQCTSVWLSSTGHARRQVGQQISWLWCVDWWPCCSWITHERVNGLTKDQQNKQMNRRRTKTRQCMIANLRSCRRRHLSDALQIALCWWTTTTQPQQERQCIHWGRQHANESKSWFYAERWFGLLPLWWCCADGWQPSS